MQEAMGQNLPQKVADEFVAAGEQILGNALQREPETRELAEFCEVAAGKLLAAMYDVMRQREGPEEAAKWLKKTLSYACSQVRFRGSDALIKIDVQIKDVPNRLAKRAPEPTPDDGGALVPPPSCSCALDAEGRCTKCAEALSKYFQAVFAPIRQMVESAKFVKGLCPVCQPAQTDYAMSTVVPALIALGESIAGKPDGVGREMLAACYQMAATMGVREMPLTEKAWADESAARAGNPGNPMRSAPQ